VKVIQGLFLIVLAGVLSGSALLAAAAFQWAQELPELSELSSLEYTATTQIFARNGELIGEILPVQGEDRASTDRIPVTLEEVSPAALAAIIASEDDQFFNHYGFDVPGLALATWLLVTGEGGRGGSTITTQVIKNVFFPDIADEQTIERKAKEIMMAIELERRHTKAEILQQWLNVTYWGGNFYGIRAASRAYFNKDPIELTLAEGLYLARLVPLPSRNYEEFAATRRSMRAVIDNMLEQGVISPEAAERAWRQPIQPTGWRVEYDSDGNIVGAPERTGEPLGLSSTVSSNLAPHVSWTVRNILTDRYGESRVFNSGGLRVYTTIDVQAQQAANQASLDAAAPPGAQVAVVGLNPSNGEILAMVGGRIVLGQPLGEFNRVTDAFRQPGSSFKPIIYATAIEQGGYTQADVVVDEAVSFPQPNQPNWEPVNHDNRFIGARTLREHLNISRNIPLVKLVEAVTPEAVAARSQSLGYSTVQPFISLALGSFEVTPLQHASAMGAFMNGGVHVEPHLITRVEDVEGNVLWEQQARETQVWTEQTAYIMLDLLRANVADSGAFSRRAQIGERWVGGKTGTTNDDRDIWFVGMSAEIASAVWIGYDDYGELPGSMPDGERMTSSRQPIYIWRDFMERALQGTTPVTSIAPPEGVSFATFDRASGSANGGTRGAFITGTEPSGNQAATMQALRITIPIDNRTGQRANADTPRNNIVWRDISPNQVGNYLSN